METNYYNYTVIDFDFLNRNKDNIKKNINIALYRHLSEHIYCNVRLTRTGFYINIYKKLKKGSCQIGHISIHLNIGRNRFHFINDIRKSCYKIEARIDLKSSVPIISRQASTTSTILANIVLSKLRNYMGGNEELLLLIEKISMIDLDNSNITLNIPITLKKEENKNNLSDEEILKLYENFPNENENSTEISYNKEKVIDIFKNNKLDEKLLSKKNIEDLYLISIILDSFIKVCNENLGSSKNIPSDKNLLMNSKKNN